MTDVNWTGIRNEYITTNISYRKLADKYGVTRGMVAIRGKDENWPALRKQHLDKTLTKTIEKLSDKEAEKAVNIDHVADLILQAIEREVLHMLNSGIATNWKNYTGALKDIKDIKTVEGMADSSLKIVFEGMESWDK